MTTTEQPSGWRIVDIVVSAVVAVAFGIVFLAWNAVYAATGPIFTFLPPAQALMYGVWLLPGVLVALIVRKPGAAFFGGLVSAAVSVLLGSPYGVDALISGAMQGAGAELGFAIGLYRRWTLPFATAHDIVLYYKDTGVEFWLVYAAATILSGAVIAGVGAWSLLRALVATGVLREFGAGRDQREI